jgi:hypothetical protein
LCARGIIRRVRGDAETRDAHHPRRVGD